MVLVTCCARHALRLYQVLSQSETGGRLCTSQYLRYEEKFRHYLRHYTTVWDFEWETYIYVG